MKPRFVQPPQDVDVREGDAGKLTCDVFANPKAEITWSFNDGPINQLYVSTNNKAELFIPHVSLADAGTYRCTASNSLGKITAAAKIQVFSKYMLYYIASISINLLSGTHAGIKRHHYLLP